jgi:hypothetical protein
VCVRACACARAPPNPSYLTLNPRPQLIEENLAAGRYPATKDGWDALCRHARLIGRNCVDYNAGYDNEFMIGIGKRFSKDAEELLSHNSGLVQALFFHHPELEH